ncbi:hypothetical protein MGYG_01799 [Nannizzia gypsea CBS 118893]|uniref:Uncharacterized protein n=1 Tax=Arthroderma gypseum (strain ATCC MYA-4604 / CBS 118893) TaxID=535722 RepID=E5R3I4_ARTGP|nr:hypothetical protein MGYG_01799 [Nannizzia gypsea CBS 118893]EFQ98783.1 hypothetical protein MGYG_01799 [Nannizzia gypsea CBS 118893]
MSTGTERHLTSCDEWDTGLSDTVDSVVGVECYAVYIQIHHIYRVLRTWGYKIGFRSAARLPALGSKAPPQKPRRLGLLMWKVTSGVEQIVESCRYDHQSSERMLCANADPLYDE